MNVDNLIELKYLLAFLGSFVTVFIKGWQHGNINKRMYLNMFFTSYIMAFLDIALLYLIVKADSLHIAIYTGLGASIAMVISLYLHDKLHKSK